MAKQTKQGGRPALPQTIFNRPKTIRVVKNIGFIGELQGMTLRQAQAVESCLTGYQFLRVSHLDLKGSSSQFHAFIRKQYPLVNIGIYPDTEHVSVRAYCPGDVYKDEMPFDHRNRRFVFEASVILVVGELDDLPIWVKPILHYASQIRRPMEWISDDGLTLHHNFRLGERR